MHNLPAFASLFRLFCAGSVSKTSRLSCVPIATSSLLHHPTRPSFRRLVATKATIMSASTSTIYDKIQAIIGTDAGDRGMKPLIVPGDLQLAAHALASLGGDDATKKKEVVVLSGFPCCVNETPPTETDGPPGTFAIARAAAALGYQVTVTTESCNEAVFAAALDGLAMPLNVEKGSIALECFPSSFAEPDETRFQLLAKRCDLLISCERAGPGQDGNCYTMRGINMDEKGLIGPLNRLVQECNVKMISIGDGGNELGMGKVIDHIINNPKIANGDKIGCVVPADYLIAASVSNWGGYALAACAAIARATQEKSDVKKWVQQCVPSEEEEVELLQRCVDKGCRDGVSGKVEATVDGMPLETSMKCLRDIREAAMMS